MLDKIRLKIDKIDSEILVLLRDRFELVQQIGNVKKQHGVPVVDFGREKSVKENLIKIAKERGLSEQFVVELYELILDESRRLQGAEDEKHR